MRDRPEFRTLRERLGGRWSLAWQTWAMSAGFVAVGIAMIAAERDQSAARWIELQAIGFAGSLSIGLFMLILHFTIYRNRRQAPVAVWIVVLVCAISAPMLTIIVNALAQWRGLDIRLGAPDQLLVIALFSAWWGCAAILLFDYRDRTAQARNALIEQAVQLDLAALQRTAIAERLRRDLADDVASELGTAREVLAERIGLARDSEGIGERVDSLDWGEVTAMLRGTAQLAVRPLSERLWNEAAQRYPRRSGWVFIPNIVREQPFRPLLIVFIHVLGTAAGATLLFGSQHGLGLLAGQVVAIVLTCAAANALMRRYPDRHSAIFIGGVMVLEAGVVPTVLIRESWVPGSSPVAWAVGQVIGGVIVILLTSGLGSWRQFDAQSRDLFRDRIKLTRIASIARSRQLAELAREASSVLHGSVQTRLHSCAMAIDMAADDRERSEALMEALAVLSAPLRVEANAGKVGDEVERKVALWGSLCDFTVRVEDRSTKGGSPSSTVIGRIVEEGISNAIRHGEATAIDIAVDIDPDGSCRVRLEDNGHGPGSGKPGIGSALLDQCSNGNWSLTALDPGARLVVNLTG